MLEDLVGSKIEEDKTRILASKLTGYYQNFFKILAGQVPLLLGPRRPRYLTLLGINFEKRKQPKMVAIFC
jgi:hypothetical protein